MAVLINKHAFGLYITNVGVKAAELAPVGGSFELIAYGAANLPPGAVVDGAIKDPQKTAEQIRKLIQAPIFGEFKTSYVVASLPESRVFLKAITIPKFGKKKLDEALSWEAKSLLPISPEEAYNQSQILEEKEKEITALIAATEKELVDGYLKTLQLAGLVPIALDLECYAAARTLKEEELINRVVLLLHIGTKVTTFTVLRNRQVWFSRAINTGIAGLTEHGQIISDKETIAKAIKRIALAVKSTINFYHQQIDKEEHRVELVTLTGGVAAIPQIVTLLQQELADLPFVVTEPRLKINIPQLAKLKGLALSTSIGLALRGAHPARWAEDLNFLPERIVSGLTTEEIHRKISRLLLTVSFVSLAAMLVLIFYGWQVFISYRSIQQAIQRREKQVASHPANEVFSWTDKANKQLKLLENLEKQRLPFHLFLQHIAAAVPEGIVFDNINFSREENLVTITGVAESRASLLAFANKLQSDASITNVSVPLSNFNEGGEGEFSISFSVDLKEEK